MKEGTFENFVHCKAILYYFWKYNTPQNRQVDTLRLLSHKLPIPLLHPQLFCTIRILHHWPHEVLTLSG